jgi:hypothetical protein
MAHLLEVRMQHRVLGALLLELTFAPDTLLLDLVRLLVALVLDRLLARVVLHREHEPDDEESRRNHEKRQPKLPTAFHRRVRKLRRHFEPLRRAILGELVGDPETLIVDSTLLAVLHPREVSQSGGWGSSSAGAAWVRWGSFSVYWVKLHLLCATNRVPLCYELTSANVAEVSLTKELLAEAELGGEVVRKLLGDRLIKVGSLRRSWPSWGLCCLAAKPAPDGPGRGSRSRLPFRASSGSSGSGRPWPPLWWGWPPG